MRLAVDDVRMNMVRDEHVSRRRLLRQWSEAAGAAVISSVLGRHMHEATAEEAAPSGDAEPKPGGILVMGLEGSPSDLNPFTMQDILSAWVVEQVYDTLFVFDQTLLPQPNLCTAVEMPDATTYVFHLAQHATFSDGSPLTAEDVKFSLEQYKAPDVGGRVWAGPIETIEAADEHTVKLILSQPWTPLIGYLAWYFNPIISKKFYEEHNGDLKSRTLGSGPFVLEEFVPDQIVRFKRNEHYWQQGFPYLDGMEWIVLPDDQARVAALRGGEIHNTTFIDHQPVEPFEDQPGEWTISQFSALAHAITAINCSQGPLADARVRQALSYAIDRNEILETAALGYGQVTGYIPASDRYWAIPTSELPTYHPNVEKAKALLTEAGYEGGFAVTLKASPLFTIDLANAQVLQQQLKAIDIDVEIEQLEWGNLIEAYATSDFELINALPLGEPDPDGYTWSRYHSQSPTNYVGIRDPDLDGLMDKARATVDLQERRAIYADVQRRLDALVPALFYYVFDVWHVYPPNLHGMTPLVNGSWLHLRWAWIDQ